MRVILKKDVRALGRAGDTKTVSDGYARNFLIPSALAVAATETELAAFARESRDKNQRQEQEKKTFAALADRLEKNPLTFTLKASAKGQAFGSMSAKGILDALAKKGIVIKKDWLDFPESIKTTGEYTLKINFPHQVEGKITINITPEKP